jgi:protein involved in polysaccharide export with SLBB domain
MVCVPSFARAQAPTAPSPTRNAEATRPDLEVQLAADRRDSGGGSAEEHARRQAEIATIQERLSDGDFQVGDRIVLFVGGQQALSDTFTVREGQMLRLPTLSDVSLRGVLRSELQGHLYAEISRFLRDPVVRSGSLVRLSILGPVMRPGFYALPADMLLSAAIMSTGGLANNADVNRTVIKRGGQIIWPASAVEMAIRNGQTIDQLNLRAGDEIDVGEKKSNTLLVALPIVGGIVAIAAGVVIIAGHH